MLQEIVVHAYSPRTQEAEVEGVTNSLGPG